MPPEDLTREGIELGWGNPRLNSRFEGLEGSRNNTSSALHPLEVTFVGDGHALLYDCT
ncbi:hypothetical protein Dalu01_01941 [Deinococcus aluminii]|uniref:MBL fold metallo-hydrolase n=1 Tax=Deinococcus aluminii TaxID=1656885 RepID=A0ABP9XDU2_9DEIO